MNNKERLVEKLQGVFDELCEREADNWDDIQKKSKTLVRLALTIDEISWDEDDIFQSVPER